MTLTATRPDDPTHQEARGDIDYWLSALAAVSSEMNVPTLL
jgi:hypothetical protein